MTATRRRIRAVLEAPSVEEMAMVLHMPPGEVEASLDDLEAAGWIIRHGGKLALFGPADDDDEP